MFVVKTGQDHHVFRLTFRVDLNVYLLLWAENMSWRLGCFLESLIVNNVQVVMLVMGGEADKTKVTWVSLKTDNQDWKFDLECLQSVENNKFLLSLKMVGSVDWTVSQAGGIL